MILYTEKKMKKEDWVALTAKGCNFFFLLSFFFFVLLLVSKRTKKKKQSAWFFGYLSQINNQKKPIHSKHGKRKKITEGTP